jgi:hypothetical protein
MQNRAARIITGKPYEIRSRDLLGELGWQTLNDCFNNVKNKEVPENMANTECSVYLIMKRINLEVTG